LARETASLKATLAAQIKDGSNRLTGFEPKMSTPVACPSVNRMNEVWTQNPLTASGFAGSGVPTVKEGNLIRKPNKYDGQTSWEAYYAQFCIIAGMNGWDDAEKAAYLATSLQGSALQVLANLSNDRRQDYQALVAALDSRFGTSHRTEISKVKLKNRVRQRDEGLPELAEDIERLARLAYADAPPTLVDTLARDQFVDCLPDDDMRLRLRQERPQTLQRALELALELESFQLANRQHRVRISRGTKLQEEAKPSSTSPSRLDIAQRMEAASHQIAQSMKKLEVLIENRWKANQKSPRSRVPRDGKCWECGAEGHFRKDCPKRSPGRRRKESDDASLEKGTDDGTVKGNSGNAV
jgi:hypothetical protein